MGFVSKSYLQTQFQNFAARISDVFEKKGSANNSFNGYKEGTWTPKYGYMASSSQFTLSAGTYTKIGNVVIARCTVSSGSKDGSYNIYINPSSLPFALNSKNFVLAVLQDVYNGTKNDGGFAGAVSSISLGNKSFSTSNASVSTYYATIIYCI